jgi:hypothetical protein
MKSRRLSFLACGALTKWRTSAEITARAIDFVPSADERQLVAPEMATANSRDDIIMTE